MFGLWVYNASEPGPYDGHQIGPRQLCLNIIHPDEHWCSSGCQFLQGGTRDAAGYGFLARWYGVLQVNNDDVRPGGWGTVQHPRAVSRDEEQRPANVEWVALHCTSQCAGSITRCCGSSNDCEATVRVNGNNAAANVTERPVMTCSRIRNAGVHVYRQVGRRR